MSIGLKAHKLLWGRSGKKCAFEDCRNELIADETETDDESIIGDEAHIVAKSINGPRGESTLTEEERDKYDNLILLCRKHHKIIDDQFNFYTTSTLIEIKKKHEKWVTESLTIDIAKNKDDLAYATYIDEIVNLLDFKNWEVWTSRIFGGAQSVKYLKLRELEKLSNYAINRFWPGLYLELENAVLNLKQVLNDFLQVFYYHSESNSLILKEDENIETKTIYTEQFYKLIFHEDVNVYYRLLDEYKFHVALVCDLGLELTRAGNLLIEKIRKFISPMYRDEEGKLLITMEPDMDFSNKRYKVEYQGLEKEQSFPYPGLQKFMVEREKRDLCFGKGIIEKYLRFGINDLG